MIPVAIAILLLAAQQEDVSYDDSVHMERTASKILELTPNQWRRIAEVA